MHTFFGCMHTMCRPFLGPCTLFSDIENTTFFAELYRLLPNSPISLDQKSKVYFLWSWRVWKVCIVCMVCTKSAWVCPPMQIKNSPVEHQQEWRWIQINNSPVEHQQDWRRNQMINSPVEHQQDWRWNKNHTGFQYRKNPLHNCVKRRGREISEPNLTMQ